MQPSPSTAEKLPRHIAVIMDGNGRWARRRALPRHAGHRAGVKSVRATVEQAARRGIEFLTLFAFSSENFRRPPEEVSKLMGLFVEALRREVDELHRNNVRLEFIGNRERLNPSLAEKIAAAEAHTAANDGLNLVVAVAYGGRWDLTEAVRRLAADVQSGSLQPGAIDEQCFAGKLALGDRPDPDLLVRTGGEQRISNFLLWHLAYAELYFCDTLWPDFREADLDAAIKFFSQRQRRYGHTGDQLEAVKC
ncbi:MAG: polyprenyl diphosphate synthase [Woeseiaceae bacterium]|nr:polyprenyl diphosphate synthase [Woeseiaceae bacterium]